VDSALLTARVCTHLERTRSGKPPWTNVAAVGGRIGVHRSAVKKWVAFSHRCRWL
jgi:hypothetical protein